MTTPSTPWRKRSPIRLAIVAMLVAGAIVTLLGVIHVRNRHKVIRLGYELTRATATLRQLQEENRKLRLEKSVLTSPDRIQRLAKDRGMTPPASGQVRVIRIPAEIAAAETNQHGSTPR